MIYQSFCKVMAKDVADLSSAKTANGQALSIKSENGAVMADDAKEVFDNFTRCRRDRQHIVYIIQNVLSSDGTPKTNISDFRTIPV